MMQKVKELIPHMFTAGNLVGGILAIIYAVHGRMDIAPYFIFASAFLDFLDGFVARLLNVQSELGKQLDSLADMVTFGVAPGVIVLIYLQFALYKYDLEPVRYLQLIALLLPVFAMFRLGKFNLDTRQSDSFIGLPTPAMTIFFVSFPLLVGDTFHNSTPLKEDIIEHILTNPISLIVLILTMSLFMVLEIPLFALKFKTFGWKGNEIRYIFLTISVAMLATLFVWAIPLIIILYLILSIINNMIKK